MIYKGREVSTPDDIDAITAEDIGTITGGVSNEFALHRKALKAMVVMMNVQQMGKQLVDEAKKTINDLVVINELIEGAISDGRKAKVELGYSMPFMR